MKRRQLFETTAKAAVASAFAGVALQRGAAAQVAGAADATQFPNSAVIPTPTPPFAGDIQGNLIDSSPAWPPAIAAPTGSPNVLLILIDDAGYGANSLFGGIVPTPALERLARRGLCYTAMHNSALCFGRVHAAQYYLALACASMRYTVLTSFAPAGGVGFSRMTMRIPSRSRQRLSAPSLISGLIGVSRARSNASWEI